MTDLDSLRRRIDAIDDQILHCLAERLKVCRDIAIVKQDQRLATDQPARVEHVLNRCQQVGARLGIRPEFVVDVYRRVIAEACRLEEDTRAASARVDSPRSLSRAGLCIDHVAIAVRNLESAIARYRDTLGFVLIERRTVDGTNSSMLSAVMRGGGVTIVLTEGVGPRSNVSQYIEHYGPGVQHIAIEVDGIDRLHQQLESTDCELLTGLIRADGLTQFFTRRDPNSGIQLEFVERTGTGGFDPANIRALYDAMDNENVY